MATGELKKRLHRNQACGRKDDLLGRSNCLKALRDCKRIIVWKLDRLGRDLTNGVNIIQDPSRRGVKLKVLTGQHASIDTKTASGGELVFGIFAALADLNLPLSLCEPGPG